VLHENVEGALTTPLKEGRLLARDWCIFRSAVYRALIFLNSQPWELRKINARFGVSDSAQLNQASRERRSITGGISRGSRAQLIRSRGLSHSN
jgi:hypothetical protein